jgi:glycerophosphoryl diester phosphodiesterase
MQAIDGRREPGALRGLALAFRELRGHWWRMAGVSLFCSLLSVAAVMPLVGLLLRWFVARTGRVAVADVDIAGFLFTTAPGIVALVLIGALLLAAIAFEQACMVNLALSPGSRSGTSVRAAIAHAVSRAGAIFALAMRLVVRMLLLLAPFAAIGGLIWWALLGRYDINYYLAHRPGEFWAALLLAALDLLVLVAVFTQCLARWLLGLPLVAVEACAPARALAGSARRMRGHRRAAAALLAAWAMAGLALSMLSLPLLQALGRAVAPAFGQSLRGMLAFSVLVALVALAASFALSVTLKALFAFITVRFYLTTSTLGEPQPDARRWTAAAGEPAGSHRRWPAVAAVLAGFIVAAAALGYALQQGALQDRAVLVFAHRGASAAAPENTLAAFRQAGRDRADFVELDVQETSDEVVVVAHDSDLMKVARSPLKIWASTAAQLRAVDIGSHFAPSFSDQRVPTLAEALAACRGVTRVDIELKDYGHDRQLEQRVVESVEAAGMHDRIVTMSLSGRMVARMKQLRPRWTSGQLLARALGRASALPVDFLAVESRMATRAFVRAAHEAGKPVYVWTVNDPQRMIRLIGLGVDGLITDHPALAREVVAAYRDASPGGRLFLFIMTRLGVRDEISGRDPARRFRRCASLALLLLAWAGVTAAAAPGLHCLWEVRGERNTVYLLGSVHMLTAADGALPDEMNEAYARSETLVMELDLNDAGLESSLGSMVDATMLPEDRSLSEILGSQLYAEFMARAAPLGIEPALAERLQPWFAALLLEQLTLAGSGLAADSGVDMQLAHRAQLDHKPIIALETAAEQLGYFSQLTQAQQVDFLRTTLHELDDEGSETATMVRAWRQGDVSELERLMREDAAKSPELYRVLTTERNRRWLPRIGGFLHARENYLVVVGALHLVGHDGLVELLRQQGYSVTQR